ncbi:hypothetical protein [Rubripirellula reticaptiva]|uniref:Uncharacterized protein n=1 Tax=Rubripirellula reticaptiva TaxID=2528013 RepID=A0A5C6EVP4_9BACT|nr:hypothetical protein [Rubripirellula reticaptiva]TWU51559.1 hypothetical protein Poly59_31520 [Rubripirellula reticaptiva]
MIGGMSALWIPLGVAIAWLPFRNSSGPSQFAVVCAAAIVFVLLWYLLIRFLRRFTLNAWSQSKLPVVEIDGDRITVRWHGETINSTVDTCNLRRGRAWQMKYASRKAGGLPFGDRELILIDLPPLCHDMLGNVRAYTTVAVGYTDGSMQAWTEALGLSGEPNDATERRSRAF